MWRGSVVVAALACPSCIKLAPFSGGHDAGDTGTTMIDAPTSSPEVMATPDGSGALVTGPHFAVHFPAGDYPYPDSVKIDGAEWLDSSAPPFCNDEYLSGMAIYPRFRAAPSSTLLPAAKNLSIDLAGPGVAKIGITWNASFACGPTTRMPQVRSTFTFFGDGRVHRYDRIADSGAALSSTTGCDCGQSSGEFALTSYVLLAQPLAPSGFSIPANDTDTTYTQDKSVCAERVGAAFGFGVWTGTARVRSPNHLANVALIYDLISLGTTLPNMSTALYSHTIWWLASGATCTALGPELAVENNDYQLEGDLSGSGSFSPFGRASDGIFGGEDIGFPTPGFQVNDTTHYRAPAGTTLPAGQAIWLRFTSGNHTNVSITRAMNDTGTWYFALRPSQDSIVVFVKDAITNTNTITITAQ